MLKDLNADETKLADLMSLISEKRYNAGWMHNLEFDLWGAINGGNRKFGHYVITQSDMDELSSLSKNADAG